MREQAKELGRRAVLALLSALLIGGAGVASAARADDAETSAAATADDYPGGPFTLVDHHGRTVTEQDFRGKFLLMAFGYTSCPDICPLTLQEIAQVMDGLGDDAGRVQPVFVTVDPERDTPEVLASYVTAFDPRIVGLSGTPEQIAAVAEAYFVQYEKVATSEGQSYFMNHSAFTHLLGPDGAYLTSFLHGFPPEGIVEEIRSHLHAPEHQS